MASDARRSVLSAERSRRSRCTSTVAAVSSETIDTRSPSGGLSASCRCILSSDSSAMVIAGLVVGIRWLVTQGRASGTDSAMQILRERYARGDISREGFEAKRRGLRPWGLRGLQARALGGSVLVRGDMSPPSASADWVLLGGA